MISIISVYSFLDTFLNVQFSRWFVVASRTFTKMITSFLILEFIILFLSKRTLSLWLISTTIQSMALIIFLILNSNIFMKWASTWIPATWSTIAISSFRLGVLIIMAMMIISISTSCFPWRCYWRVLTISRFIFNYSMWDIILWIYFEILEFALVYITIFTILIQLKGYSIIVYSNNTIYDT